MDYTQKIAGELSRHLQRLRDAVDTDIKEIESLVPSLTLAEIDSFAQQTSGLVNSYRRAMNPLYRNRPRPTGYRERPARVPGSEGRQSGIEQAAMEMMQQKGYVSEAELSTGYGFNRNAVRRKLGDLVQTYGWERERSPEDGWRYAPKAAPPVSVPAQAEEVPEVTPPSEGEKPARRTKRKGQRRAGTASGAEELSEKGQ